MLTSEFAAELSHDLRVPLASIIAHLEVLEDELGEEASPVVADVLTRTMRAAERMQRMLEQRIESGRVAREDHLVEVDLNQVAQQLAVDSAWLLERSDATLEVGWLPVVHADADEMYCVLQNLLTNAVKYVRPGVCPKVQIASRRVPYAWHISVTDNGIGIPAGRRLDVFTLHRRANSLVEGHGIGLATVARIVHALGGRVGADEAQDGGAEVWFELPTGSRA
jgi:signal transduction histidine kinase